VSAVFYQERQGREQATDNQQQNENDKIFQKENHDKTRKMRV